MTSNSTSSTALHNSATIALWLNRAMEALWLATVFLIPIIFIERSLIFSEAVIAFMEVPKVALLRILVGLMTILWLVEWGIKANLPNPFSSGATEARVEPRFYLVRLRNWLSEQPTRWLVLAVWFFAVTTLISTVFSASVSVSLWGEVPGQDGLTAYTLAAHLLLFGVIAAHLKTRSQLWRLLGVIIAAGVVAASFAVLQHYGQDPLGALEASGGGVARVTSTVGNAVFAGALMLIPIAVSLMLSTVSMVKITATNSLPRIQWSIVTLMIIAGWALVLTIQFLGLIFTFSRGPWLGTLLALVSFLALTLVVVGWRAFGWAGLVLGLSSVITWAILQSSDIGLAPSIGTWLIVPLALAGMLATVVAFRSSIPLGQPAQAISGLATQLRFAGSAPARLLGTLVLGGVLVTGAGLATWAIVPTLQNSEPSTENRFSPEGPQSFDVTERFASVSGDILSGDLSNRFNIWKGSAVLMRDHPWFEFDDLTLPWLRPLVGYGPDMFRYTYLLVSVPLDTSLLPAEPDHAHNFIINQGVEQGLLGLLSAAGLFVAAFGVAGYQLLRKSRDYSEIHRLVFVGLVAAIAGRFLEQSVGLTRISDLMLFMVVLAILAALPTVMVPTTTNETAPLQEPARPRPKRERRSRTPRKGSALDLPAFVRLAIVAWAVGGIVALTWVKAVNYPRAALAAGEALEQFQADEYAESLEFLDRSTQLAPDVPIYYAGKAATYTAYLRNPEVQPEPECSLELNGVSYTSCLVQKIHFNNILGSEARPFDWRSRLARANSALALGQNEEAIRLYREVTDLAPSAWLLHNRLAEAYIDIGQPEKALEVLDTSLEITKSSLVVSDPAVLLQIRAREQLEANGETPANTEKN